MPTPVPAARARRARFVVLVRAASPPRRRPDRPRRDLSGRRVSRAAAAERVARRMANHRDLPRHDRRADAAAAPRRPARAHRPDDVRARRRHADGGSADRILVAVGVARAGGDDHGAGPARHRPGAPHRAAVRPPVRRQLARHRLLAGDDRRDARLGRAVDHRARRQHHPADYTQRRRALRLAAGPDGEAPRRVPDGGDLPGQRRRLRDVHDRPGEQRARDRPGGEVRQRPGHLEQLAARRSRPGAGLGRAGPVRRLPHAHAGHPPHAGRCGRTRATSSPRWGR